MASATYKQCSAAARRIMKINAVFTEIDIVNSAAEHEANGSWGSKQFKDAYVNAQQICAALYRSARIVRFGPVHVPGLPAPDYARKGRGGKIVYAGRGLVDSWETPNGTFPALAYYQDEIKQNGRKRGIDRDDSKPWADQAMGSTKDDESLLPDLEEMRSEIERLRGDLGAANRRNGALQEEVDRLRSNSTPPTDVLLLELPVTDDLVEQLRSLVRDHIAA